MIWIRYPKMQKIAKKVTKMTEYKLFYYMNPFEVQVLFTYAKSEKIKTAMYIQFFAGLRIAETTKLKPIDVDFSKDILVVRSGKGNKDRAVPLHPRLIEQIFHYKGSKPFCDMSETNAYKVYNTTYQRALKDKAIKPDINMGTHIFRHSFAMSQLDAGTDIRQLQGLMCHSNIKDTMKYLHLKPTAPEQWMQSNIF